MEGQNTDSVWKYTEELVEFKPAYLVFVVFAFCSTRQGGMAGGYKAVIWFLLVIVTIFLKLDYIWLLL